jgi:host factor-I protein
MEGETGNLQNEFFNAARKERKVVTIFLGNGKKLTGRIKSFDKFTLLLEGPGGEQIIFKHAISTVSSARWAAERDVEGYHPQAAQGTDGATGAPAKS